MIVGVSVEKEQSRRQADRSESITRATMRPFKAQPESVQIVNISTDGCGFESRWPFREGMTVVLYLPDLEPWPATVKWWNDGRGGAEFVRKLHPAVVARYADSVKTGSKD